MVHRLASGMLAALVIFASPAAPIVHAEGTGTPDSKPATTAPAPAAETLPPSLPIVDLEPFQHESTGLTGLRPANWQFASDANGFGASPSNGAPEYLVGVFVTREEAEKLAAEYQAPAACACRVASWALLESLKRNVVDGPEPEVLEQVLNDDGSGTVLVATTTRTRTSQVPIRVTTYARTTIRPDGLILAFAGAPAERFAAEGDVLRQMVDSVAFPED